MKKLSDILSNKNRESGSVLFIVIMVLIVVSLLGILILTMSHYNNKLAGNETRRKRAFYIAEAGAMEAILLLNHNEDTTGLIFDETSTPGGTYTVYIYDSTTFSWLPPDERIIRSIGKSRNAVRRLELRVLPAFLDPRGDIPGPLYIEAEEPQFAGNSFYISGGDHHYGLTNYHIPVPPGDHRAAVASIHDSTSLADAIGNRDDQVFTVDDTGAVNYPAMAYDQDTFDLEALADIYAGPNGEFADTINWVYGQYPNNMKVCYFPGDITLAGGGHSGGGGGSVPCKNCNGTGVITCFGCDGTGYEWSELGTICSDCRGTGRIGCATCDSVGYFVCPDCGGTGGSAIACDSCEGTGTYGCMECYGTGVCPICGGSGKSKIVGSNYWSCYRCGDGQKNGVVGTGICGKNIDPTVIVPGCGGTGGIDCPFCGGTGVDPTSGCSTCGGTGQIACPDSCNDGYFQCATCGGMGTIGGVARICAVCSGSGERVCPYCDGNGTLPENGAGPGPAGTVGAGVLIVRGDMHISGQFEWTGLIICLGKVSVDITGGGQGIHIWGSLLCQSVDFKIAGNADINWCSDALRQIEPRNAGWQIASVTEY
ncbi:MAG: PilX N-terminal domain-containing pilus assembly protein [bacterium]